MNKILLLTIFFTNFFMKSAEQPFMKSAEQPVDSFNSINIPQDSQKQEPKRASPLLRKVKKVDNELTESDSSSPMSSPRSSPMSSQRSKNKHGSPNSVHFQPHTNSGHPKWLSQPEIDSLMRPIINTETEFIPRMHHAVTTNRSTYLYIITTFLRNRNSELPSSLSYAVLIYDKLNIDQPLNKKTHKSLNDACRYVADELDLDFSGNSCCSMT